MPDTCRSCHAPIRWAPTVASKGAKAMPLDPEPSPHGNVRILEAGSMKGWATVLAGPLLGEARAAGLTLYTSHFVTCEFADQHRGKSRGG